MIYLSAKYEFPVTFLVSQLIIIVAVYQLKTKKIMAQYI